MPEWSTRSRSARRVMISASWTGSSTRSLTSSRCTGSTTSSGRKPPRTCTCCGSPTGRSPRAGTASTSSAVQIDVPETLDISNRAQFYDATGAVLDMLVTHLFQVAAEVAMEPPASLGPLDLQAAREEVISCFRPLGSRRGGARPVRRVPGYPGDRSPLQPGHVRRRPAVDRHRPLARRAFLPAHRQADGRVGAAGQPGPARAGRTAQRPAAARRQRALPSRSPGTARSTSRWWPRSQARR